MVEPDFGRKRPPLIDLGGFVVLVGFILFALSFTQGFTWQALALLVAGVATAVAGKELAHKRRGTSKLSAFSADRSSPVPLVDALSNPPSHTRSTHSD
jgi:hypothetical protein